MTIWLYASSGHVWTYTQCEHVQPVKESLQPGIPNNPSKYYLESLLLKCSDHMWTSTLMNQRLQGITVPYECTDWHTEVWPCITGCMTCTDRHTERCTNVLTWTYTDVPTDQWPERCTDRHTKPPHTCPISQRHSCLYLCLNVRSFPYLKLTSYT